MLFQLWLKTSFYGKLRSTKLCSRKYEDGEEKVVCQYCDRIGHVAKDCWFIKPNERPTGGKQQVEKQNENKESGKRTKSRVGSRDSLDLRNHFDILEDEMKDLTPTRIEMEHTAVEESIENKIENKIEK